MKGYCPECGCTTTGPLMFGEIVCDDPDCGYVMWEQQEEKENNGNSE